MSESSLARKYRLRTAPDKLSAWIELIDSNIGALSSPAQVHEALAAEGVVRGIIDNAIELAFDPEFNRDRMGVAMGDAAEQGADAWIEYFVDIDSAPKFVVDESSDRVDFKTAVKFTSVNQGDLLCEIHPPTYGVSGWDIYGKEIVPKRGSPVSINVGEGVYQDGYKYFAARSGRPQSDKGLLKVLDVLQIDGDVGFQTGNVRYPGPVVIKGDVPDGFEVYSDSDVTIGGNVGDALVVSRSKVLIAGGIIGRESAKIVAGTEFECRFANYATIECQGNVAIAKDLLHCTIETMGQVFVKGRIMGGRVTAKAGIEAGEIGAINGLQTCARINFNYETERMQEAYDEILAKLSKLASAAQPWLRAYSIAEERLDQAKGLIQLFKLTLQKATKAHEQLVLRLDFDRHMGQDARIVIKKALRANVTLESPGCKTHVGDELNYALQVMADINTGKMRYL